MTFDETLEKLKANEEPKIILEALTQLSDDAAAAASAAQAASRAYYDDVAAKEKKIAARISELVKQRDGLQTKIEAFREHLAAATISGNAKKLDDINASMKALEADKRQVSTEIDMLESYHVKGEQELYNAVIEASDHHASMKNHYQHAKEKVYALATEREKAWAKIQEQTRHTWAGGGNGPDIEALKKHHFAEEYARREEQVAAQRIADAEAAKAVEPYVSEYFRRPDPEPSPEPVQTGKTFVQNPEIARRDGSLNRR